MGIFKSIGKFFAKRFSANNLSAAEKWVAMVAPDVAADLMAISKTLPSAFASLEDLAGEAIKLVRDLKSVTISKSLAIHLAQAVLTANWDGVEAEAQLLLTKAS